MKDSIFILLAIILLAAIAVAVLAQDEKWEAKEEILTVYNRSGRPTYQAEDNPGWHRIMDSVKLVEGIATVNLNTSTATGGQDVSFISPRSYGGYAWNLNVGYQDRYYIVLPRNGKQFRIHSSNSNDTSTVYYLVEGQ